MRYIGIDPGKSGGIAYVDDDGWTVSREEAAAWPMPETDRGVLTLLWQLTEKQTRPCCAMIERVASSPQMGVVSAFSFGRSYGGLLMALAAMKIAYDQVAPVKWQNLLECRTPKERRAELGHKDKNINKRRAEQLFPRVRVTHAIADALLLAEYARRVDRRLLSSARGENHGEEDAREGRQEARGQSVRARRQKGRSQSAAAQAASEAGTTPGHGHPEGPGARRDLFSDR
jgi:hypothetical protein